MEELSFFWIIAGLVIILALRNFLFRLFAKRAVVDDYAKDLHDILTKDEHKVKGRFD